MIKVSSACNGSAASALIFQARQLLYSKTYLHVCIVCSYLFIYLFIYCHLYSAFSIVQCSNALYRL